jgi:hypothetical protein
MAYYRGQSRKFTINPETGNDLTPTIIRNFQNSEFSIISEAHYYKELIAGLKEVLKVKEGLTAETLGKFQHYLIPTRLLDISKDQDVAYFFACNNHFDQDGYLYTFDEGPNFISLKSELRKSVTRKIESLENSEDLIRKRKDLNEYFRDESHDYIQPSSISKAVILDYQIVFGEEKVENIRYLRQQGSFILFGNKTESEGNKVFLLDRINFEGLEKLKTEVINFQRKLDILYELAEKGKHHVYFFPDDKRSLSLNAKYHEFYHLVNEIKGLKLLKSFIDREFLTDTRSDFLGFKNYMFNYIHELYQSFRKKKDYFYFVFCELLSYYNYFRKLNLGFIEAEQVVAKILKAA